MMARLMRKVSRDLQDFCDPRKRLTLPRNRPRLTVHWNRTTLLMKNVTFLLVLHHHVQQCHLLTVRRASVRLPGPFRLTCQLVATMLFVLLVVLLTGVQLLPQPLLPQMALAIFNKHIEVWKRLLAHYNFPESTKNKIFEKIKGSGFGLEETSHPL